jgi:endo-1,4-beta-xylanase
MKIKFFTLLPAILMLAVTVNAQNEVALKTAFKKDFLVGAALNPSQFCESNKVEAAIIKSDFSLADKYVDFGVKNRMFVIGHTLVWHSQTPDWVFQGEGTKAITRDLLLQRMRDHIFTLMGRYKGRVKGWDVVNEALDEDGSLRDSPWHRIIGDDFIQKAFEFAHAADPDAELYYNDYGLENATKRAGAVELIKKLQAQRIKITSVGLQGHYNLNTPTLQEVDDTISAFQKLGVNVMVTELDINVLPFPGGSLSADISERYATRGGLNPYTNGLPDTVQRQLAQRYADFFSVFLKHADSLTRVTLWGVTDENSWLNDWPVPGRTNYPLLFDRAGKPKPALMAVIKAAAVRPLKQARK